MTLVYANTTDYGTWTGSASPANVTQLLRSASILVRDATQADFYDIDPNTNLPTDATILQAFKDATCAHAAAWATMGVDPLTGGVSQPSVASSKGIGTARVAYADAQMAAEAKAASLEFLVPEAQRILRDAGLMSTKIWLVG